MRTRSVLISGFASVVMIAAGCGSKPLQNIPTGAGGSISTGIGGVGWIDGGAIDAPWNPPFAGRRSFIVQSQLQTEAGVSSHAFTMVVDTDRRIVIVGASGSGWAATLLQVADGTLRLDRSVVFALTVSGACDANVRYDSLAFNVDAGGGLSGGGLGQLTTVHGDVASSVAVTMSLTGAPDTVAPRPVLATDGSDITDPFTDFWVSCPEPLPVESYPALRATGGDVVVMNPVPKDTYIVEFSRPGILLRYGETYAVDVEGISDFAGNRAVAGNWLTFTTKPPPPLVAADGFESVTDATLGGAEVLSADAGAPTISGNRSLYVPPVTTFGAPPTTQLALRLSIAPGNTVLRFSFRNVTVGTTPTFGAQFRVASVGGTIVAMVPTDSGGTGTSAVIDRTSVTLGPVTTAAIALPADAIGEVVVARITSSVRACGPPLPLTPGIIIDDLRAE